MYGRTFEIEASPTHTCWAELQDGKILIHRTIPGPDEEDQVLVQWDVDVLRNLLSWADQGGAVTTWFTGPMAQQIRAHAKELSMTPEMLVWHAVKVFIEVGAGP